MIFRPVRIELCAEAQQAAAIAVEPWLALWTRLGLRPIATGRSEDWIKVKNPSSPAATRLLE